MLSFFPRGVLDEILNLVESVSEGFPSYSYTPYFQIYSHLELILGPGRLERKVKTEVISPTSYYNYYNSLLDSSCGPMVYVT